LILLDSNALIWLTAGDPTLGSKARRRIEAEASSGNIYISAMSFWEVAMLLDKNRLELDKGLHGWAAAVLEMPGVNIVHVDLDIALAAGSLPGGIHGDPADRIIVATARALGCPVLTSDRQILAYAEAGHVTAVDARL
jgi:PIN domain nuclease of toxin-antitoxin system